MDETTDLREVELVLTELNLTMLFLDLGSVEILQRRPDERVVHATLSLGSPRGLPDVESIVGRLLRNELVSRVVVDRADHWGRPELTTTCVVTLARHDWTIVIGIATGSLHPNP